ncbi:MAG: hypothetical protein GY863_05405 [bacterium]|nr:hypothetical protein [bacterium]
MKIVTYNNSIKIAALVLFSLFIFSCSDTDSNPLIGNDNDITPPEMPTGLQLPVVDNGEIFVQWSQNSEIDLMGYRLYRAEDEDRIENYQLIYDSTSVVYTDRDLDYETTYIYRVSAYDHSGNESPWSQAVEGTPLNTRSPEIPENLVVIGQNIGSPFFHLTWDENPESDVAGYKIYRGEEFNFLADASSLIDSTLDPSYIDQSISVDIVYYYKITAYDLGGRESPKTEPESDVALSPPVLTGPIDDNNVSATPTFTWNAVPNTVQYKIILQTSIAAGEIWVRTLESDQTSITYDGSFELESGNTYFWKVATITKDPLRLNSISNIFTIIIQ